MELQQVIDGLCAKVPGAIGVIVCDYEGESVVIAHGKGALPEGAIEAARSQLPQTMQSAVSSREFLMRVVGAEPCATIRMIDARSDITHAGPMVSFEVRYDRIDLLVRRLPEDYYVVLALARPSILGLARTHLDACAAELTQLLF